MLLKVSHLGKLLCGTLKNPKLYKSHHNLMHCFVPNQEGDQPISSISVYLKTVWIPYQSPSSAHQSGFLLTFLLQASCLLRALSLFFSFKICNCGASTFWCINTEFSYIYHRETWNTTQWGDALSSRQVLTSFVLLLKLMLTPTLLGAE